jgi:hypothetical protein
VLHFLRKIARNIYARFTPQKTGTPAVDLLLEAGPAALTPDVPEEVRLEIANSPALGWYREAWRLMAQEQQARLLAEIKQIGRENRRIERKATTTHVPYCRIPKGVWDQFEAIYGVGCWQDEDFMEDFLKHHPECRIIVKRGIRGQEYVGNGRR